MSQGILITFEGIDGSGKTSMARLLASHLSSQNYPIILTKEPGATPLGKQIRALLHERTYIVDERAEFLLFAADRAQHLAQVINPALKEGKIVISDRFADSSLAYQGFGRCLDRDLIARVNKWALDDVFPDLIVYIKIDYATALKRIRARGEQLTAFEKEQAEFFERVINGFDTLFKDRDNVIILDGTQEFDVVSTEINKKVVDWFAHRKNHSLSAEALAKAEGERE